MQTLFYVSAGGETKGPYTLGQIKSMWGAGVLTADAMYWSENAEFWQPLADIASTSASVREAAESATTPEARPFLRGLRKIGRIIVIAVLTIAAFLVCFVIVVAAWSTRRNAPEPPVTVAVLATPSSLTVDSPATPPAPSAAAGAEFDAQVNASWKRVAITHHDAGVPGTPLHDLLEQKVAEIFKANPAYFKDPDWPERLTNQYASQAKTPPPATPEPDTYPPIVSAVINGPFQPLGYGQLKIINGTDHPAIVKVHQWNTGTKFVSFSVLAHSSYQVDCVPDNAYRILFGLGDRMHPRTDHFSPTLSAFEFDKPVTFESRVEADGTLYYSKESLTLQAVPDGNITDTPMRPVDFDAW